MRFIHHLPWERIDRPAFAERRIEEYEADSPAIYIAGMDEVGQMLADHPEIGFVVSIYDRNINDILDAIDTHRPNGDVRYGHFPITDWDIRAAGSEDAIRPNRENVGELLTFLRQWYDAATSGTDAPSLLVHCAQGMYRSGAAALTGVRTSTLARVVLAVGVAFARFSTPVTPMCFLRVAYIPATLARRPRSTPWLRSVARPALVPE